MGCNADKDMRSGVHCTHRRVLECQDCRCTFAVRYTDDVIQSLLDRVKELESKLGAADVGLSTDREAVGERPITTSSPPAAPSVSAEAWRRVADNYAMNGGFSGSRACDLAAAVTEFCEREWSNKGLDQEWDLNRLGEIAFAFVRGEPLPQKGG